MDNSRNPGIVDLQYLIMGSHKKVSKAVTPAKAGDLAGFPRE